MPFDRHPNTLVRSRRAMQALAFEGQADGTTIVYAGGIYSVNVGAGLSGSGTVHVLAADASILVAAPGLKVQLNDHPPATSLSIDFTTMAVGTVLGTIGGAGVTWHVSDGSTPVLARDDTDLKIQTYAAGAALGVVNPPGNSVTAIYMPAIVPGSKYLVQSAMFPTGTAGSGGINAVELLALIDNVGWSAQGVLLSAFQDSITLFNLHGGIASLGTSAIPSISGYRVFGLRIDTVAQTVTAVVDGVDYITATKTTDLANTAVGVYLGSQLNPALTPGGVKNLSVTGVTSSFSGLVTATGGVSILVADTSLQLGAGGIKVSPVVTTKGDLYGFDTANQRIPVGANTFVLTADSTQALGLKWAAPASAVQTTKGDLAGFSTLAARVPVGADGLALMADSTAALGVSYQKFSRVKLAGGLGTAVTNSIVNTSFGLNLLVPANTMIAGRTYRLKANLHYTALNTSQRVEVDVWLDSKVLGGSGIAVTTAVAGNIWIEVEWHIVTIGAGGTFTQGGLAVADANTGPLFITLGTSAVAAAIDTTVAHTIDITGLWTVASPSNSVNVGTITIEEIVG